MPCTFSIILKARGVEGLLAHHRLFTSTDGFSGAHTLVAVDIVQGTRRSPRVAGTRVARVGAVVIDLEVAGRVGAQYANEAFLCWSLFAFASVRVDALVSRRTELNCLRHTVCIGAIAPWGDRTFIFEWAPRGAFAPYPG